MPSFIIAGNERIGTPPQFAATSSVNRSLILTPASTQYLSRLGSTEAKRKTFTINIFLKLASIGQTRMIYTTDNSAGNAVEFAITNGDQIQAFFKKAGVTQHDEVINQTFTDTTSWHAIGLAVNTADATASERVKLFFDGSRPPSSVATQVAQDATLSTNPSGSILIGANADFSVILDAKIAAVSYIDGQHLDPSSFMTGNPGVPRLFNGNYTASGAFSYYLNFDDNSSTTNLGLDSSGAGNDWTLNNMTVGNSSPDHP